RGRTRSSRPRRRRAPCLLVRLLCGRSLGSRAPRFLGRLSGFLGAAARFLLSRPTGFFLAPARLFGGGQNRDLFLLAPLGIALGRVALLLDQRTLAGRLLGGGQSPPGAGASGRASRGRSRSRLRGRLAGAGLRSGPRRSGRGGGPG